jgi:hypothetical protein
MKSFPVLKYYIVVFIFIWKRRLIHAGADSVSDLDPTVPRHGSNQTKSVFVNLFRAYIAWRAGTTSRVIVPARQSGNRFLGSLKGLQIRALVCRRKKRGSKMSSLPGAGQYGSAGHHPACLLSPRN